MDIEFIRDYCLKKKSVKEELPFGPEILVFKVVGKMFLACRLDETPLRLSVKCDPELAIELREKYTDVIPGYHMNKKMWNTVYLTGSIPQKEIIGMIDHSYGEVVKGLPKKIKEKLGKN
jgi:predicted DNA-binding protein (MmcQ/YjbR family)